MQCCFFPSLQTHFYCACLFIFLLWWLYNYVASKNIMIVLDLLCCLLLKGHSKVFEGSPDRRRQIWRAAQVGALSFHYFLLMILLIWNHFSIVAHRHRSVSQQETVDPMENIRKVKDHSVLNTLNTLGLCCVSKSEKRSLALLCEGALSVVGIGWNAEQHQWGPECCW